MATQNPLYNLKNLSSAISASFKKAFTKAPLLGTTIFDDWEIRRKRYTINWAFYENTAYSDVNDWAQSYRKEFKLPREIEGYYNPIYQLAEFWVAHVWGGFIDREIGDGTLVPTAIPIKFSTAEMSEPGAQALAKIYQWSNWQVNKDVFVLWGNVLGDVFLRVVDDPSDGEGKVYFEVVHPGSVSDLELDARGNVLGYTIQEDRLHPEDEEGRERWVVYKEVATLDEGNVTFTTYLDDEQFGWDGNNSTWNVPYGFMPMVYAKNKDVGLAWGWSEFHPIMTKIHNLDKLTTSFSEFIMNSVKAPWLFSGVKKPSELKTSRPTPTAEDPSNKDKVRVLYASAGATAQHLVSPLELEDSIDYLAVLMGDIEKAFPELSMDNWAAKGETSARGLRIARQKTEKKAIQRRATYDFALILANQMALSIGKMRGYSDFTALPENSYDEGLLVHEIVQRPVFAVDELENAEIEKTFWEAGASARDAGMALPVWLKRQGWTPEEITELVENEEYQNRLALQSLALNRNDTLDGKEGNEESGGKPTTREKLDKQDKEV